MEVHINLSHISPPQVQSGSQLRINQARRMVHKANKTLHRLEVSPLSVLTHFYEIMEDWSHGRLVAQFVIM